MFAQEEGVVEYQAPVPPREIGRAVNAVRGKNVNAFRVGRINSYIQNTDTLKTGLSPGLSPVG